MRSFGFRMCVRVFELEWLAPDIEWLLSYFQFKHVLAFGVPNNVVHVRSRQKFDITMLYDRFGVVSLLRNALCS
jgi:hypothetical protein